MPPEASRAPENFRLQSERERYWLDQFGSMPHHQVMRIKAAIRRSQRSYDSHVSGEKRLRKYAVGPLSCSLKSNPLDLVERESFLGAVVELGGARALVRGHGLGVLQRAAILQVRGNS